MGRKAFNQKNFRKIIVYIDREIITIDLDKNEKIKKTEDLNQLMKNQPEKTNHPKSMKKRRKQKKEKAEDDSSNNQTITSNQTNSLNQTITSNQINDDQSLFNYFDNFTLDDEFINFEESLDDLYFDQENQIPNFEQFQYF